MGVRMVNPKWQATTRSSAHFHLSRNRRRSTPSSTPIRQNSDASSRPTGRQVAPVKKHGPKQDGDPEETDMTEVYNQEGKVMTKKEGDKEVNLTKPWSQFSEEERQLWRDNSGGSSIVIIVVVIVVVLLLVVIAFFVMGGSSDEDEELV